MSAFLLFFISIIVFVSSSNDYLDSDSSTPPNIIFIMADDLGWGNLGYNNPSNEEISTPHIDSLVLNEGLRLNRHYVWQGCTPSRSSFQTGRLPVHVTVTNDDGLTDSKHGVPVNMMTIAAMLKKQSIISSSLSTEYATHLIGKWDIGQSTVKHLPTSSNRGYDSFFGYLGKNLNYWSLTGDDVCDGLAFYDLWNNDEPLTSADILEFDEEYVEYILADKIYELIDDYGTKKIANNNSPFFITYSSHLPHYPTMVPEEYYNSESINDESQCMEESEYLYPDYDSSVDIQCRSAFNGMVQLLDNIIGKIVDKLKTNNLWDNTLLIFTSDNGGSLEVDGTAANNYPLRGGKSSGFEGGIRSISFISGGYLPSSRYGKIENGIIHISDWYTTFCKLVGGPNTNCNDNIAKDSYNLPDIDGLDVWPLISGKTLVSPHTDRGIPINSNVYMKNEYKLIIGHENYAIWADSSIFPNSDTPTKLEMKNTILTCPTIKLTPHLHKALCLFNVANDIEEQYQLTDVDSQHYHAKYREIAINLYYEFEEEEKFFYDSSDSDAEYGKSLCPAQVDYVKYPYCSCWVMDNIYDSFTGPYEEYTEIAIDASSSSLLYNNNIKKYYNNQNIIIGGICTIFIIFIILIKYKSNRDQAIQSKSIDNNEISPLLNRLPN